MSHDHNSIFKEAYTSGYGIYLKVWLGLVVLTGITVIAAGVDLQNATFNIATALFIASVKVTLVVYFFMHLKYETLFFKVMIAVCAVTFIIFIGLTFFDISFR